MCYESTRLSPHILGNHLIIRLHNTKMKNCPLTRARVEPSGRMFFPTVRTLCHTARAFDVRRETFILAAGSQFVQCAALNGWIVISDCVVHSRCSVSTGMCRENFILAFNDRRIIAFQNFCGDPMILAYGESQAASNTHSGYEIHFDFCPKNIWSCILCREEHEHQIARA